MLNNKISFLRFLYSVLNLSLSLYLFFCSSYSLCTGFATSKSCTHCSLLMFFCSAPSIWYQRRALLRYSVLSFSFILSHVFHFFISFIDSFPIILKRFDFPFFLRRSMADEVVTPPIQSEQPMNNFLYLHPSENPTTSLVSPVLDSTNYHSWSRSIITALSAKNKVEFILGDHSRPSKDDPIFFAWSHCNNMVVSLLVHSFSIPIR